MIPVPGYPLTTPYGRRGPHWSCHEDEYGNGIHTGADYAAPQGTAVVAARPGRVVHCNHGSPFGFHQLEILPGDGTRDFYAHMTSRVADGVLVRAGDRVGTVGAEGNATGPHLHFERHAVAGGGWSCGVVRNPQPSIDYRSTEEEDMPYREWPEADRAALARDVADAVWARVMQVTKPDGTKAAKEAGRILRETWSKLSKHIDVGG